MKNIINSPKKIELLRYLYMKNRPLYPMEISRKTRGEISKVSLDLCELYEQGWVTREKKGRRVFYTLTDEGRELAMKMWEIVEILKKRGACHIR